jgi:hypothetical protein
MGVDLLNPGLLATAVHWGGFKWTGSFTTVDLIAASTDLGRTVPGTDAEPATQTERR